MSQKTLSVWLRVIAGFIAVAGSLVFLAAVPSVIDDLALTAPSHAVVAALAKTAVLAAVVPFRVAVTEFYLICMRIGQDRSFSLLNIRALGVIGYMAIIDTAIIFAVFVLLTATSVISAAAVLVSIVIMLLGVLIAVAAFTLSHLVLKAYRLKEDNDLTV